MEYKDYIVPKPWGEEYLVFESDDVAIWLLKLNTGQQTSLHCHPNKKTGLIVLDGEIKLSFLSTTHILPTFAKTVIREGVFHSSKNISNGITTLLEVECPKNKTDLVRLEDNYGRKGKEYEDSSTYIKRGVNTLWIPNENGITLFGNYKYSVLLTQDIPKKMFSTTIIIALSPNILHYGQHWIVKQGDVLTNEVFTKLTDKFSTTLNSKVLTIESIN